MSDDDFAPHCSGESEATNLPERKRETRCIRCLKNGITTIMLPSAMHRSGLACKRCDA